MKKIINKITEDCFVIFLSWALFRAMARSYQYNHKNTLFC